MASYLADVEPLTPEMARALAPYKRWEEVGEDQWRELPAGRIVSMEAMMESLNLRRLVPSGRTFTGSLFLAQLEAREKLNEAIEAFEKIYFLYRAASGHPYIKEICEPRLKQLREIEAEVASWD